MKYDIQTVGFDATPELTDFLDAQLENLKEHHTNITGIDVYLKTVPDDEDENKVAEIKVFIPGPSLYAEHQAESFEEAIMEAAEKIRRQLEKAKGKQYNTN